MGTSNDYIYYLPSLVFVLVVVLLIVCIYRKQYRLRKKMIRRGYVFNVPANTAYGTQIVAIPPMPVNLVEVNNQGLTPPVPFSGSEIHSGVILQPPPPYNPAYVPSYNNKTSPTQP